MNVLTRVILLLALVLCRMSSCAQTVDKVAAAKLSSSLRAFLESDGRGKSRVGGRSVPVWEQRVCALVRTADATGASLHEGGCRIIDNVGDIFIVDMPVGNIARLASDSRVRRIEAERGNVLQLDSMAYFTDAEGIREGGRLPRAYTGDGVVVGLMDVGFDLTHPTFRKADGTLRICRFWDQLSTDTVGSSMYVGAEYTDGQSILGYAHSRDGVAMYHGTHTLGIAAGGGAGTSYVGMAPESDICLVSNAVNGDEDFISDADMYKYTTATDVLGFKYLFDYAESVGKPCVVSFSEGAPQDFRGDNQLYYEALSRLVGPGRIIVASAGNRGLNPDYVCKPLGRKSAGTFVTPPDNRFSLTVKSRGDVLMRTRIYFVDEGSLSGSSVHASYCESPSYGHGDVLIDVPLADVCAAPDSLLSDTILIYGVEYVQTMQAYRSCFDAGDVVVDVTMARTDGQWLWQDGHHTSFEVCGEDAVAEVYRVYGGFGRDDDNISLNDAEATHGILSPGSAPDVICAGGTACRPVYTLEYDGKEKVKNWGVSGERGSYSSVGPTFDGRSKPDVMAPGANIISAMSSFYMEENSEALLSLVGHQDYDGRTYGWSVAGGTSMSAPAVAGIIALWLQANPKLSPDDVRGIFSRTCRPCGDYGDATPQYCGYGMIDAYAGLLDILNLADVDGLSSHNPRGVEVSVKPDGTLCVTLDAVAVSEVRVSVFDTGGRLRHVGCIMVGMDSCRLNVGGLQHGVYAVQIDTGDSRGGSLLVRI